MEKELKLSTIVSAAPALSALAALDNLPAKAAYGIARMLSSLDPALKAYTKARLALVKQYGVEEKDEKEAPTGRWRVLPANEEAFAVAHEALLEQTPAEKVQLFLVNLGDLCDEQGRCRVTPGDLANLEFCIQNK